MNDVYSYASTDQVTGVTYGSGRVVGYQYDPLGNLTQKVDNGTADNYTANSLNQYTFINGQALSYDTKGNLLQRPGWAYTWDAHNRLRSAEPASPQSGSLRLTFAYDGRNRCAIRRTYTWTSDSWLLTTSAYLTYSDWNLLEERDAEGTLAAAYVHGPEVDDIIARITASGTLYYHANAQHSTVAVTGAQGDVLERHTYDIFGLPTVRDGASYATLTATAVGNRLLFQGREWLAEVKLTDHRNRLCSSEMQRWLNRDPSGESGGINLSAYLANCPTTLADPIGFSAGGIAGAIGVAAQAATIYLNNHMNNVCKNYPCPAQRTSCCFGAMAIAIASVAAVAGTGVASCLLTAPMFGPIGGPIYATACIAAIGYIYYNDIQTLKNSVNNCSP